MSQYTAPDKITGDQWSSAEHNEMKAAVNSKFDANKLVQDLLAPSNSTTLSTAGISLLIGANSQFKGRAAINVANTLNTIKDAGFYLISGNQTATHDSFPTGFKTTANGGELIVYYDGVGKLIQQISAQGDTDKDTETYRRSSMNNGTNWSAWDSVVYKRWLQANYGDPDPSDAGSPTIVAPDFTLTKIKCTDLMGRIIAHNDSVDTTVGTEISVSFEYSRPNIRTVQLTKYLSGADSATIEVLRLDSAGFAVRILGELEIGSEISFFYFLK